MDNFTISAKDIKEFCQKWQIKTFYLFGSTLRSDFDPAKK